MSTRYDAGVTQSQSSELRVRRSEFRVSYYWSGIMAPMTFVLIHSPLIGPSSWQPVAVLLRDQGHHTIVPDLRAPPTVESFWSWQVAAVTAAVGASGALVLVAHSGAGPLLPASGAAIAGRVERYVLVDAALPRPGRSRLEALPVSFADRLRRLEVDGWLPPWHEWFEAGTLERLLPDPAQRALLIADTTSLPFRMLEEPLPGIVGWPDAPCSFVRLSAAYDEEADYARSAGWEVVILDAHHLAIMTDPGQVAAVLTGFGA
jgi:hypothetical protein